ncbi:MAG: hypothetical protein CM1200mP2_10190 [Planctomycetaceae bacterium]|nr:MAG: hypothetical protein CM1200mP2_10190 [Planctomycetaceae bacterium]
MRPSRAAMLVKRGNLVDDRKTSGAIRNRFGHLVGVFADGHRRDVQQPAAGGVIRTGFQQPIKHRDRAAGGFGMLVHAIALDRQQATLGRVTLYAVLCLSTPQPGHRHLEQHVVPFGIRQGGRAGHQLDRFAEPLGRQPVFPSLRW